MKLNKVHKILMSNKICLKLSSLINNNKKYNYHLWKLIKYSLRVNKKKKKWSNCNLFNCYIIKKKC